MSDVPEATAVTSPVAASTVATAVLLLLHVPPVVPLLLKVAAEPTQSVDVPETVPADTLAFTVTAINAETGLPQPVDTVYVISVVPAATAVTSPVAAFTVATEVLLLLHVPPVVPFVLRVVLAPAQSTAVPVIVPALTFALTVTVKLADTGLPQPVFIV